MTRSNDHLIDCLRRLPKGAAREPFFDEAREIVLGVSEGVSLVSGSDTSLRLLPSQVAERRASGEQVLLKGEPNASSLKCFVVLEGVVRWWPDNTRPAGVEVDRGGVFGFGLPWGEAPHAWTQRVCWWWALRRRNGEFPPDEVPRTVAGFRWPGRLHAEAARARTVIAELRWPSLLSGLALDAWEKWAEPGGGCDHFLERAADHGWYPLLDHWESHTPLKWSERHARGRALVQLRRFPAATRGWPLDSPGADASAPGVFAWPGRRARQLTLLPPVYVRLAYPPTPRQQQPLYVTTALAGPRMVGDFEYTRSVEQTFLSCGELLIGPDAGSGNESVGAETKTLLLSEIGFEELDRVFERGEDADLAGPFFRSIAKRAVDGLAMRNTRPSPTSALASWLLADARRRSPTGFVSEDSIELITREVPVEFLEAKVAFCFRIERAASGRHVIGPARAKRAVKESLEEIVAQCKGEAQRRGERFQYDIGFDVNNGLCRIRYPSLFNSRFQRTPRLGRDRARRES